MNSEMKFIKKNKTWKFIKKNETFVLTDLSVDAKMTYLCTTIESGLHQSICSSGKDRYNMYDNCSCFTKKVR